jgi:hypothetical protein
MSAGPAWATETAMKAQSGLMPHAVARGAHSAAILRIPEFRACGSSVCSRGAKKRQSSEHISAVDESGGLGACAGSHCFSRKMRSKAQ